MATFANTTPSPPPGIQTPPTPRHGTYCDHWEPYAQRKSSRLSSQRAAHRTPSPASSHRTPPRTTRKAKQSTSIASSSAAIMSPTASPQKKRQPTLNVTRHSSGSLMTQGAAHAASALGLDKTQPDADTESRTTSITRLSGMLPTPVKTPKKPATGAQAASIQAVARNLFAGEEAGPSQTQVQHHVLQKKRLPKKYSGISMESFTATEVEESIEIYTDSHDRVPEVDNSEENPFYGDAPAQPEIRLRRSKRKVAIPGEGSQDIDRALQREDGMVYVFRGKKIFRKFAECDEDAVAANGQDESTLDVSRPLTRSSIKPRRLFQAPEQPAELQVDPEDEEAVTDIEEDHMHTDMMEDEPAKPQTPQDQDSSCPATPLAPRFGPAPTPPDTRRTSRFGIKGEESTPSKPRGRAARFSEWRQVKSRSNSAERAPKRAADGLLAASAPKRTRS